MTIVRVITPNTAPNPGDWLFGKSLNDYVSGNAAVKQNIQTRLFSFLGDCFFNITAGIDWFNLLGGSKNEKLLSINVSSVILNTPNVTGLLQLSIALDQSRKLQLSYQVQTAYSVTGDIFQYDLINSAGTGS